MSDRINIFKEASNLHTSPQFSSYSKVVIHIDDETDITVGDDYGRTLEVTNPFGTRQMAEDMLAKLSGFQYQPYDASGALLDPAAEIGDAISIKNIYGGLYTRDRTFSRLMKAEISAPHDEEINHEYQFETPQERKVKREFGNVKATLAIQADRITAEVSERTAQGQQLESQLNIQATEIAAKVSQTGGSNPSFGWSLTSSGHTWYSGNNQVMKVNSSGLEVTGKVTATSGVIGGFSINASDLRYNNMTWDSTQSTGIYIGSNGIKLGQRFKVNTSGDVTASSLTINGGSININNKFSVNSSGAATASSITVTGGSININDRFKVDSQGNLTATSGTFSGNIYAKNIQYGGNYGTFSGSGLTAGSISYGNGGAMATGWYSGAVGGNVASGAFNNNNQVTYLKAAYLAATSTFSARAMSMYDVSASTYRAASWKSDTIVTGGDVDVGFGNVFQVFDVNGDRQWCGNALWGSFEPEGDGQIHYIGR